MSEEVKPALTAEEWARAEERGILIRAQEDGDANWEIANDFPHFCEGDSRHALAAISLHGQPFGFAHVDVLMLRAAEAPLRASLALQGPNGTWDFPDSEIEGKTRHADALRSLAARIEALLPPDPRETMRQAHLAHALAVVKREQSKEGQ